MKLVMFPEQPALDSSFSVAIMTSMAKAQADKTAEIPDRIKQIILFSMP